MDFSLFKNKRKYEGEKHIWLYIAQFLGKPERSCLRERKETWKQSNTKIPEFEMFQSFPNHPR